MEWISTIKEAINYIEKEILTIKNVEEVAKHVNISPMYLQQGFNIITGFTIGEYIKNRRLYLAALELNETNKKIIDIAYKYGYVTPESFTKAFKRFHGVSPSIIKKDRNSIKIFSKLMINIIIQGGNSMDYIVEDINEFKVIGFSKYFSFDNSYKEIPQFWDKIYTKTVEELKKQKIKSEIEQAIIDNNIGEFGICIDDKTKKGMFKYMIAGIYKGGVIPEGMEVFEFPKLKFAKFKCIGQLPNSLQSVNTKIWKEWLPSNDLYELDASYNIEWYSFEDLKSNDYHSSIWIPVKNK